MSPALPRPSLPPRPNRRGPRTLFLSPPRTPPSRDANLHLTRKRAERACTGRAAHPPPSTLRAPGGSASAPMGAAWALQPAGSRRAPGPTPSRATRTIPASASRPPWRRLPGTGRGCCTPAEHGHGAVCHGGTSPSVPVPSASLCLCSLLFNPGLCSLRFKLKYPEQM